MDDNSISVTGSSSQSRKRKRKRPLLGNNMAEINDFLVNKYPNLIPGRVMRKKHADLIGKVDNLIKARFRGSETLVYGSTFSETAVKSSDIDISVNLETDYAEHTINVIKTLLIEEGVFKELKVREVDGRIGLFGYDEDENDRKTYIDITLNNRKAREASEFIRSVAEINISVKMLLILVKEFTKCHNLNDQRASGLASVGFTYMAVLHLQLNKLLPQFLNWTDIDGLAELVAEVDAYKADFDRISKSSGNTTVSRLLCSFFRYYAFTHDFERDAVSILRGQVVTKESLGWGKYTLAIVDPFGDDNVGKSVTSKGLQKIRQAFKKAHETLVAGRMPHNLFKQQAADSKK